MEKAIRIILGVIGIWILIMVFAVQNHIYR